MSSRLLALIAILLFAVSGNAWARDAPAVSVEELAKTTTSWDGSVLPAYPPGQPQVTILKYTVGPFESLPWHEHPVINAGVLISGKLTVVTEQGEKLYLTPGDAIVEVLNKWHHGVNEGPEPAEIIVFYAGVENTPLVIKKEH